METNTILNRVLNLLEKRLHVDRNLLTEENYTLPLTGEKFDFSAAELGHLFCLLEEEFRCRIDTSLICRYEFNSIAGIADVLVKSGAQ
jgi:acyl carrier protein